MLVLGELFQVPLETLLIREDGSPAYHRIFDGGFPYHIGLLFQEKTIFPQTDGRKHVQICLREITTQKLLLILRNIRIQKCLITDV